MKLNDSSLFRQQGYINGQWCNSDNDDQVVIYDPANNELLGSVPNMGRKETQRAIVAAQAAQPAWRALTAKNRANILNNWARLMMSNQDDLAMIMTREQGKPLTESKGEIAYAASYLEWFAEEGKRIYGDIIPSHGSDKRLLVQKEPIGVAAAITPWNFPSAMITRKVAPALAAGCAMVLKPAPQTPFSALALAYLAEQAGVPAGLFSVLPSDTSNSIEIGKEFCENRLVRKLSFTGSTAVGIKLIQQSASSVKKISLELGGNAPFIVFDDADLDAAVEGAVIAKYRNAGQTCVCANRFYVQEGVYDSFVEKFAAAIRKLEVGNGINEGVNIGPLINQEAVRKVYEHQSDALSKGAKLIVGGEVIEGNFYAPTLLSDVTSDMTVAQEETFGPLAPVFRFTDEADVIYQANNTEYGLASYFYARDLGRVFRVSDALEYGMVGVNTGLISTEQAPFGGIKSSGLGREGSKYGIDDYLEIKYVCLGGL